MRAAGLVTINRSELLTVGKEGPCPTLTDPELLDRELFEIIQVLGLKKKPKQISPWRNSQPFCDGSIQANLDIAHYSVLSSHPLMSC